MSAVATFEAAPESLVSRRAVRVGLAVACVALTATALVAIASYPSGARDRAGVVPLDARLVADVAVDDVHVLLLSQSTRLRIEVAYEGRKGWLGVLLPRAPRGALAAWASTPGDGPVPALSVVYGRVDGATVRVHWSDGTVDEVETEVDGSYVAARPGRSRSDEVEVLDGDGTVTRRIDGP